MSIIELPYRFKPRKYQNPLIRAVVEEEKKHILAVMHRRAGKTISVINAMVPMMMRRPGAYYYIMKSQKQAREVVWLGRGKDGVSFKDYFHPKLIVNENNTSLMLEFAFGSLFFLFGSTNVDSKIGSNALGIAYDEWSVQDPHTRDLMTPVIMENGGFEIIICTPRGNNHAYDLYQTNLHNPDWHVELLTVDDTTLPDGSPVVSREKIDELRRSGLSENVIQQEFYCSWEAAQEGSYFGKQLSGAYAQDRIREIPIKTDLPVYTAWDIGTADSTAIWFFQVDHEYIYLINYFESKNEAPPYYIDYLHEFKNKYGIVYEDHFAPHDGAKREWTTNTSIIDTCHKLGITFKKLERPAKKQDHIENARGMFSRVVIDPIRCRRGIACLKEYRANYNETMKVLSKTPLHNWASHGADAFMYVAQAVPKVESSKYKSHRIVQNKFNTNSLW